MSRPRTTVFIHGILVTLFWIPATILRTILRHLSPSEYIQPPLRTDVVNSLIREVVTHLPLDMFKYLFAHLSSEESFRQSLRFQNTQDQLCTKVMTENRDIGIWICRGNPHNQQLRPSDCDFVLLFFHGGAYVVGDPTMNAIQQLRIAEILSEHGFSIGIFSAKYTLAPAGKIPLQQKEALEAYKYLIDEGIDPKRIIIAGESAGGHLALSLLYGIANEGLARPIAAFLVAPWVNLLNSGRSFETNKYLDSLDKPFLDICRDMLIYKRSELVPLNFADLSHELRDYDAFLPESTWVTIGGHDLFLTDCETMVSNATKKGLKVAFEVVPGMGHTWQKVTDMESKSKYLGIGNAQQVPATVMSGSEHIARMLLNNLRSTG